MRCRIGIDPRVYNIPFARVTTLGHSKMNSVVNDGGTILFGRFTPRIRGRFRVPDELFFVLTRDFGQFVQCRYLRCHPMTSYRFNK